MSKRGQDKIAQRKSEKITRYLQNMLGQGRVISEETLFFAESTYGISVEGFGAALADKSFEDREILLGFICFPDDGIRLSVEQIINGSALTKAQESAVGQALIQETGEIRLYNEDHKIAFQLCVGESVLASLVAKLYLTRRLDEIICNCLEEHLCLESFTRAKIILRCRGDQFPADSCEIFCRLIRAAALDEAAFLEIFQTGLEILAGRVEGMSCEQCFLEKKRELLDRLKTIGEFAKRQNKYGFEYLLMQKYPVPTESEELVLARLRVVAKITDELLCLGPASPPFPCRRDLGDFIPGQDLDQLFRILS